VSDESRDSRECACVLGDDIRKHHGGRRFSDERSCGRLDYHFRRHCEVKSLVFCAVRVMAQLERREALML
jgi:hypothetical protein